jgi:predicted DsbA family dithiol-disulfide isomerase
MAQPARDDTAETVLQWYDFVCPFCYVAQHRTAILVARGFHVIELPFQAHPAIPPGGITAGHREGPMHTGLDWQAKAAGLMLLWPARIPNSRMALAAAEWVRRFQPRAFVQLRASLFDAHFVLGEDLEDLAVIDRHARKSDVDPAALHIALDDGSAAAAVTRAETVGREHGVSGAPSWLVGQRLITGLRPAAEFEQLTPHVARAAQ